jgi:hypothetical protein
MIEEPGFQFQKGQKIFMMSRLALRPGLPSIQCKPGALSSAAKVPVSEDDHSPPSSAEFKNALSYTVTPSCAFIMWFLINRWYDFSINIM